jgi:hypothetical protein
MEVKCVFCDEPNPGDAHYCHKCENSLIIGKLTSNGTGVLSKGFSWEIRPCDHFLGRNMVNDFVIPGTTIAEQHACFVFGDDCFYIKDESGEGNVFVNGAAIAGVTPLPENCIIRIANEEFRYSFSLPAEAVASRALRTQGGSLVHPPSSAGEQEQAQVTSQLQLLIGIISGINTAESIQQALQHAVDAVLRITQTARGYCFMLEETHEGTAELQEVVARRRGNQPLEESGDGYTISQSFLAEVLAGNGSILIEDAMAQHIDTNTVRRFKLKTIVCLPLMDASSETVIGVIYADDVMPTAQLPEHTRNSLLMLMESLSTSILKWQQFDRIKQEHQASLNRLKELHAPIASILDQMQEVRDMMSGLHGPLDLTWSMEKAIKDTKALSESLDTLLSP